MNLSWAIFGAAAGLVAGAAWRGSVFRLSVSSGSPERTLCLRCAAPIRRWPGLRCSRCGASLGPPAVLEVTTAVVLALVAGRFAGQPDVLAFCYVGAAGVALAAIDLDVQRLPDRITLPAIPVTVALLGLAAILGAGPGPLIRSILGGLAMAAIFLLLALIRPGQLGGGDIKLAALLGVALGWLGWKALFAGAALGFVLGALSGLALVIVGRATMRSQISFGPYLVGGALIGMLAIGSAGR